MHTFSIPVSPTSGTTSHLPFSVDITKPLLFAGSRNRTVDRQTAHDLVQGFGSLGFSFVVGCAKGVDASFARTIAETDYRFTSLKACAFSREVTKSRDLFALKVAKPGLSGKAALVNRTIWMTDLCSMLVLFPSNPVGKGSRLAFRTTINQGKPVFVVGVQPQETDKFTVYRSEIFGVKGYWCLPKGLIHNRESP